MLGAPSSRIVRTTEKIVRLVEIICFSNHEKHSVLWSMKEIEDSIQDGRKAQLSLMFRKSDHSWSISSFTLLPKNGFFVITVL